MVLIVVKIFQDFSLFAAKSVLKQLMKVDPAHRITAKELLDNQWITVSYKTTSFFLFDKLPLLFFFLIWSCSLYIVLKQSIIFTF